MTGAGAFFPSPLEGESGRGSDRMRGAGGARSGHRAAVTPHPYPLPQGERGLALAASFSEARHVAP